MNNIKTTTNKNTTPRKRIRHINEILKEQEKRNIIMSKEDDYPPIIIGTTTLGV